ncbi:MAG TPA: pantoate--beta-alanine ligase [Segetibacter sp.]|nr:pantoate--beta-alanine ligase [Segetibacter sp.]
MILYKATVTLKKDIEKIRLSGKSIGFVPTMGALHKGHVSLINISKNKCDITVCSIFVNPTQFNDPTDFEKYPSTLANDILLLENSGCDILFLPSVAEMYPSGTKPAIHYDLGDIEYILEGKYRPGHFQGVCQVVHRLLDMVNPHYLYLGQKDYQQTIVIKRLLQLINHAAKVITVSTFREDTGLAMSSRNLRLTAEQKENAVSISKMLHYIADHYLDTPPAQLEKYATNYLLNNGFHKVDYVSIAEAETLQPVNDVTKAGRLIALIAAFISEIRLIDNMILKG